MAGGVDVGTTYTNKVAFVYLFNLIVGVGALALPIAFEKSGLLLGPLFLGFIAFVSFVTVTFVIEAQSIANALIATATIAAGDDDDLAKNNKNAVRVHATTLAEQEEASAAAYTAMDDAEDDTQQKQPLLGATHGTSVQQGDDVGGKQQPDSFLNRSFFSIDRRVEMGLLADMFMGKWGRSAFYGIICIYLYGDLSIYAVSVPLTLAKVSETGTGWALEQWYLLYVAIFAGLLVPFCFFNIQKTKYLQYFTLFTRNLAFFTMVIVAFTVIAEGSGATASDLKLFDIAGIPAVFGTALYSFMCHHSLPSIIAPVEDKSKLTTTLFPAVFASVLSSYCLLCLSAVFAFGHTGYTTCNTHPSHPCNVQELYTLNFASYDVSVVANFLALYPVFTLTTNYPIIAVTLRNNLKQLFGSFTDVESKKMHYILTLAAALPPIFIAAATRDVDFLVSVTGSYAGMGIMMVFPALMLYFARKEVAKRNLGGPNPHESPFAHPRWITAVLVISAIFLVFNTFSQIFVAAGGKFE